MKRQATYHGEIGANGKAYQKGQFIAEQVDYSTRASSKKGSGKQEIAPYVWEVAPDEDSASIYKFISAFYNPQTKTFASNETLAFYEVNLKQLESLVSRYEEGERWYYPNQEVYI